MSTFPRPAAPGEDGARRSPPSPTFRVQARFVLARPMPHEAVIVLVEEFPAGSAITATSLVIQTEVCATGERQAAAEGLSHVFATLEQAGMQADTYALDGFEAQPLDVRASSVE